MMRFMRTVYADSEDAMRRVDEVLWPLVKKDDGVDIDMDWDEIDEDELDEES